MTSANVIEYNIMDSTGKIIAHHRQNIMCKRNTKELLKIENPENYTIHPYGYDEEEGEWVGEPSNLKDWLSKNKNEIK